MFCDGCGGAVQAGQAFCSKCGKQIIGPIVAAQGRRNRVEDHIQLLAILWFAVSALSALGGVVILIFANAVVPHLRQMGAPAEMPVEFLGAIIGAVGIVALAKSACGFVAGWGLMKRESWARVVALVLGFISLINFPFGTALGVYTLWVLLPSQSQAEYETLVAQADRAA